MDPRQAPQLHARIADGFARIPHNQALGMRVLDVATGAAVIRLDYRQEFLGDPAESIWHTGPAISLADAAAGLATLLIIPQSEAVATLDLRMDYLRPAVAGEPLVARGECHRLTRRVAFARVNLHQGDADRPTALCAAAFMRTRRANKRNG
ncbi:MAG: PaaI family thioesterase [Salinisphaera sp.]|nr:PaaI family thioesterase [Salinisphaera sp.]